MGAKFVDLTPNATTGKYRFGISGTIIRPTSGPVKFVKPATQEELFNRRTNALRYKSILVNPPTTVNEIIMAYRSHPSNDFPMFASWNERSQHFRVMNVDMTKPTKFIITNQGQYIFG